MTETYFLTILQFCGRKAGEHKGVQVPVSQVLSSTQLDCLGYTPTQALRCEIVKEIPETDLDKYPRFILPDKTDFSTQEQKEDFYPDTTLTDCKKIIQTWLAIEDTEVLDIVFAFAIGEDMPGDPLWLFLIAPPGGCKTELLRALNHPRYYQISDLTSKTFVSGLMLGQGKERRKIEDLLPQLDKKILVLKDFTTILEKNKDERREIIAQLREIYDGSFSKKFGTIDKKISYTSRFGIIAGVTPIIDKHWKIMQQLGERFLKVRWREDDDKTTRQAEINEGKELKLRAELHKVILGYLLSLQPSTEISLPAEYIERLISMAKFLALIRTPVQIYSGRSDFYNDFIPSPERPTRLVKQLKKLAKCLAIVRGRTSVTEVDIASCIRVALDTAPQDRLEVLKAIITSRGKGIYGCNLRDINIQVKLPDASLRNIVEQLKVLDLVTCTQVSQNEGVYANYIIYVQPSEKTLALYPPTFSGRPANVDVQCALPDWLKENDHADNQQACVDVFGEGLIAHAITTGLVFIHKPGWLKVV